MRNPGTHRSSYELRRHFWSRRGFAGLGVALLGAALAGCAAKPVAKPVVTPVAITLVAGADANPDAHGRASPLIVRVYALKSASAFETADFFSLYDKEDAALGAELAQREELLLRPGESKKLDLVLPPDVRAIGVLAAFRDLERARWREVHTLQVGQPVALVVGLDARQIRIQPG